MSLGQLNKKFDWLNDLTIKDKDTSRLDELANLYNKTKDKKYYESKNLSLDSSKSFKLLKWKTILSDTEALKMTFDWFLTYYKKRKKINLVNFSLRQIELFKKKVNLK